MHLDPRTGLWQNDDNDYQPRKEIQEEAEELAKDSDGTPLPEPKQLNGSCVLSVRFNNHGEYLKWQTYFGSRQWDFIVNYPAVLRAEYPFRNSLEVEMMAKKIVQLLECGFDVYSAAWKLEEKKK